VRTRPLNAAHEPSINQQHHCALDRRPANSGIPGDQRHGRKKLPRVAVKPIRQGHQDHALNWRKAGYLPSGQEVSSAHGLTPRPRLSIFGMVIVSSITRRPRTVRRVIYLRLGFFSWQAFGLMRFRHRLQERP
jgi:hypothetical protein